MQKTIEKIHRKFDTASEKALAEAREVLKTSAAKDEKKIERFKKIGFTSGKPIKDAREAETKIAAARNMIDAIDYYAQHYPGYKFITESEIQKICKKYGLLYGDSSQYTGDIPEKNLQEIEAFTLREEDYTEDFSSVWGGSFLRESMRQMMFGYRWRMDGDRVSVELDNEAPLQTDSPKSKPAFKICAPKTDFNTIGYEVKDGYKLIYDPIVIQPVSRKGINGGLIISKWGLEGEDESLVNEKMN
jgi:hypothetical protein